MGGKVSDARLVPLCHKHHLVAHSLGRMVWGTIWGIDPEEIIEKLHKAWEKLTGKLPGN